MRQRRRLFKLLIYLLLMAMAFNWSSSVVDTELNIIIPAGLEFFVEFFLLCTAALIIVLA
jgi:hypothetical protein